MVFCIIYILLLSVLKIKNKFNQLTSETIINPAAGTDDRFVDNNNDLDILLHFQKNKLLQQLQNNNLSVNSKLDLIEKSDLIDIVETIKGPNLFANELLKDADLDFDF